MDFTVDIVIAGRNEAKRIGDCLAALQSQDYPRELLSIYVVDDGSTDATVKIAQSYGVHVLRCSGKGAGAARNIGIAAGSGELVGFLDAHCIPEAGWVSAMTAAFTEEYLGGSMGWLDCLADDVRVQEYLDTVERPDERKRLLDTLSGTRNIYPWILSGNTFFRRTALEGVHGFSEELEACEDVDISWRIVLSGYQLTYVPSAKVVHYEGRGWPSYLYKGLRYGAGAAEISHRFGSHGAARVMRPHKLLGRTPAETVSRLSYVAGYASTWARMALKPASRPSTVPVTPAGDDMRRPALWGGELSLRISPHAIYWRRPDADDGSVIVHIPSDSRFVLEGAGDCMWRSIVQRRSRDFAIKDLVDRYSVAAVTASADLDDFVSELAAAGVLEISMKKPELR